MSATEFHLKIKPLIRIFFWGFSLLQHIGLMHWKQRWFKARFSGGGGGVWWESAFLFTLLSPLLSCFSFTLYFDKKPRFRRSLAKNGLGFPIVLPGDIRTLGWLFTRVQSRMQCFSQNAIFRLNYRKPAALINGQEAQSHSTWSYAKAKASLAFSQCAADWCFNRESKNSAYKGMINQLTDFQAFSPSSWSSYINASIFWTLSVKSWNPLLLGRFVVRFLNQL